MRVRKDALNALLSVSVTRVSQADSAKLAVSVYSEGARRQSV